jgi:hypothetical protein
LKHLLNVQVLPIDDPEEVVVEGEDTVAVLEVMPEVLWGAC